MKDGRNVLKLTVIFSLFILYISVLYTVYKLDI